MEEGVLAWWGWFPKLFMMVVDMSLGEYLNSSLLLSLPFFIDIITDFGFHLKSLKLIFVMLLSLQSYPQDTHA